MKAMHVRHFRREVIPPKSYPYPRLEYAPSLSAVDEAAATGAMTAGSATLLKALLDQGGIAQFPGGLGLAYNHIFKHTFDVPTALPALVEMAGKIKGRADVIIAPEHSAIIPAALIAAHLNIPVIKVRKNGETGSPFSVLIDSYTGGKPDILSVSRKQAASLGQILKSRSPLHRAWIVDEIFDTGAMTEALAHLMGLLRQSGVPVELEGAISLMEKLYTGARGKIRQTLHMDVLTGVPIEDIGTAGDRMWLKVPAIPQSLTFAVPADL